jgi:uncharacterized protein YjiS (DUF1127 family)
MMSQLMDKELDLVRRAKARTSLTDSSLEKIDTFELTSRAQRACDAYAGRALGRLFGLSWLAPLRRALAGCLPEGWRRRARMRRTVRELSRLDGAMLADVGIARSEIRAVSESLARGPIVEPPAPGLLARWAGAVRRRMAQQKLVRELSALDDHVLSDIGIQRGQIPAVAWEAVAESANSGAAPAGDLRPAAQQTVAGRPQPANLDRRTDVRSVA